jgi:hypothetical protein
MKYNCNTYKRGYSVSYIIKTAHNKLLQIKKSVLIYVILK